MSRFWNIQDDLGWCDGYVGALTGVLVEYPKESFASEGVFMSSIRSQQPWLARLRATSTIRLGLQHIRNEQARNMKIQLRGVTGCRNDLAKDINEWDELNQRRFLWNDHGIAYACLKIYEAWYRQKSKNYQSRYIGRILNIIYNCTDEQITNSPYTWTTSYQHYLHWLNYAKVSDVLYAFKGGADFMEQSYGADEWEP